jgi:hypothetical protein
VTQNAPTPWKTIAIVLAVLLVAALISLALIVSGVMKLGVSRLKLPRQAERSTATSQAGSNQRSASPS